MVLPLVSGFTGIVVCFMSLQTLEQGSFIVTAVLLAVSLGLGYYADLRLAE